MHRRRPFLLAVASLVVVLSLASGALANSVQEQRARLPPPASCTDPVEGVWMSHKFSPDYGDWYIFTLTIQREPGHPTRLKGAIEAHSWDGTAAEEEPPPCRMGLNHWTVLMTAEGEAMPNGEIRFGGTSWRPGQTFCGWSPGPGSYNLDNFSGTIDATILEFQSVNNDGGRSVNDPMVFRRVRCLEPAAPPRVTVAPPPFYPGRRSGGCGR